MTYEVIQPALEIITRNSFSNQFRRPQPITAVEAPFHKFLYLADLHLHSPHTKQVVPNIDPFYRTPMSRFRHCS